ncbi:MAG: sensor histidine kinase [Actinomycetes bacterium]
MTPPLRAASPRQAVRSMWRRLPLPARFLVTFALILTSVLAAVVWQLSAVYARQQLHNASQQCVEEVHEYSRAVDARLGGQPLVGFTAQYLHSRQLQPGESLMFGFGPSLGNQVIASPGAADIRHSTDVTTWLRSPPTAPILTTVRGTGDRSFRVLVSPIRYQGHVVGIAVAAENLAAEEGYAANLLGLTILVAVIALAAALLAVHFLLRRTLLLISGLRETAMSIGASGLSGRLSYQGPDDDDVGRLATAFNVMLDRLEASFTTQRQLLANVSHQLRTPLAVTRGHLELADDAANPSDTAEAIAIALEEVDHMRLLVERLMLLGRALEPDFLSIRPVRLLPMLGEVLDAARVLAPRRWVLVGEQDLVLLADETKLRAVLLNLLDNAAKATREDDQITLTLVIDADLVIEVGDTGRGIATEDAQRVFDRFVRVGPSTQPGTGLGLAIVKAVVEAHGGTVGLRSALGVGTTVSLRFPRSATRPLPQQTGRAPIVHTTVRA